MKRLQKLKSMLQKLTWADGSVSSMLANESPEDLHSLVTHLMVQPPQDQDAATVPKSEEDSCGSSNKSRAAAAKSKSAAPPPPMCGSEEESPPLSISSFSFTQLHNLPEDATLLTPCSLMHARLQVPPPSLPFPFPLPNSSSTVLWLVLWPVLCYAVLRCDLCFLCTAVPQVSPQGRVREMRQIVQWQVRLNGNGNGNGADDTPPSAQRSCRLAHTPTELSHVTSSRHQRSAQLMPA